MNAKPLLLLFALVSVITWLAAAQPVWLDGPPNLATNTLTLPPGWSLIDPASLGREGPDRVFSNLDKVDPEICVFTAR